MAENESNPTWKTKDMKLDESVNVKLLSPKAIASGKSQYGLWEMWTLEVTNKKVYNRDKSEIDNYTGKAIIFPSEKLREKFIELTDGVNENVEITITKKAKTNERGGLYTDYEVELIDGGSPAVVSNAVNPFMAKPTSDTAKNDLNGVEQSLITEAKSTKLQIESTGEAFTKEQFVQGAISGFNVKEDRAGELWDNYMM